MRDYKKYKRSFIVLTPESTGYAVESRKLAGTALLEIRDGKGKLTISVHGLKATQAALFKLYLISSGDSGALGVPCGIIEPDNRGKAEKIWEFEPGNVGGSGIKYDEINVVAIIVRSVDLSHNEIIAPLVGYRDGLVIWKSGFKEYFQNEPVRARETAHEYTPEPEKCVAQEEDTQETELAIMPPPPPEEARITLSHEEEIISNIIKASDCDSPQPPRDADERIVERIIKEGVSSEYNDELYDKIKPPLREHYENARPYYKSITEKLPEDKRMALNSAMSAALDYISDEAAGRIADVLEEAEDTDFGRGHREIASIIGEYAPAKVTELLAEAFEDAAVYLDESSAASIIAECCGVWKAAQTMPSEKERIRLKSGLEGEFTLREPVPGEDHNQRFKEALRNFSEQYYSPNGEIFRAPDELPEPACEAEDASNPAFCEDGEPLPESAERTRTERRDTRDEHRVEKAPLDDARLFKLFDSRKQEYPFPGARHSGPGAPPSFPPVVPPVIPIFDIHWIRITESDFGLLPVSALKYLNSPFVILAYRNYRYFILGVSGHGMKRVYYLGVPGAYSERDRVTAASVGFEGFLPVEGGKPRHGGFGYWLAKL